MAEQYTSECEFGSLNIGLNTATLRARLSDIGPQEAFDLLADTRAEVTLQLDDGGQERLPGMEHEQVMSVADVKGYHTKSDGVSFGLSFAKTELPVRDLTTLANGPGKISIRRIGAASAAGEDD